MLEVEVRLLEGVDLARPEPGEGLYRPHGGPPGRLALGRGEELVPLLAGHRLLLGGILPRLRLRRELQLLPDAGGRVAGEEPVLDALGQDDVQGRVHEPDGVPAVAGEEAAEQLEAL